MQDISKPYSTTETANWNLSFWKVCKKDDGAHLPVSIALSAPSLLLSLTKPNTRKYFKNFNIKQKNSTTKLLAQSMSEIA